ncbi:adenine deaminase [Defluviitalea phaphyphila]|uniref:adenine deaminase n=1 Tax=Defluviitalea phaphyphila TaxID=1473580 RepID=UPI001FA815E2|nr:adenine deaminase [Defluviitalea phaphyphila]
MSKIINIEKYIDVAAGRKKAELVLKNTLYLNVFSNEFIRADIAICDGIFIGIGNYLGERELDFSNKIIVPGFIDSHIHLESSLIDPIEFSQIALKHGTTSIITDPHEIANVCGKRGINFMLDVTKNIPLDVYFMIPSCVPATQFDESGAIINSNDINELLKEKRVLGLAEMMNYYGVIEKDDEIIKKIKYTLESGKQVDGHAPFISGIDLNGYIVAGVKTDHECSTFNEALEKLQKGLWIMIREGTACKNLEALLPLISYKYYERCVFATDDKHPEELLLQGHIDYIIRKSIKKGVDKILAYKVASYNAARCFGLSNKGAIAPGFDADFVVLDDLDEVSIVSVYKKGINVLEETEHNKLNINYYEKEYPEVFNTMHLEPLNIEQIRKNNIPLPLIGLIPGEIITKDEGCATGIDTKNDILKLCVIERHKNTGHIGIAYVKGYGLKKGAIATSISHDSHNIIAIGAKDEDIVLAVNELRNMSGGMVIVLNGRTLNKLPLKIAGLMSDMKANLVIDILNSLKEKAYELGVNKEIDPFMTLSFLSLPVVPKLKLTTFGVVNVEDNLLL